MLKYTTKEGRKAATVVTATNTPRKTSTPRSAIKGEAPRLKSRGEARAKTFVAQKTSASGGTAEGDRSSSRSRLLSSTATVGDIKKVPNAAQRRPRPIVG